MSTNRSKTKGYVFAYINPDTDGVCSSLGYSFLKRAASGDEYTPVVFGNLNDETLFVLEHYGVCTPVHLSQIPPDGVIAVVDTHHRNQLPPNLPFENVVEIVDHHPTGDMDAFPNAKIHNEQVGAVATIITERIRSASLAPDAKIAGLLAAAIISNTVNFNAPSTSERDKLSLKWLQNYVHIDQNFISAMFDARSTISTRDTKQLLVSDYKEFTIGNTKIGIAQLETAHLSDFISRADLPNCLAELKLSLELAHIILNGIDILRNTSTVVAIDSETRLLLQSAIGAPFDGMIATFPRILLRKTDLVPQLKMILENR